MRIFGSRKTKLLAICLSAYFSLGVASCPKNVPEPPEVWQCQFNGTPRSFYCENNKTFEKIKIPLTAPSMKGAQCLGPKYYSAFMKWVDDLKLQAQERCQ